MDRMERCEVTRGLTSDPEDRVQWLIRDAAGLAAREPLRAETLLHADLGIESLQLALLMFRFEDEFGIDLAAAGIDIGVIQTVGDVLRTAKELLTGGAR